MTNSNQRWLEGISYFFADMCQDKMNLDKNPKLAKEWFDSYATVALKCIEEMPREIFLKLPKSQRKYIQTLTTVFNGVD